MFYEKFPLDPIPPSSNQFCPHCGATAYLTKFQNIRDGNDIPLIMCENEHAFTMNTTDVTTVLTAWDQRV